MATAAAFSLSAMETAFVFLVFIRIFIEVGGKGEYFDDPWTPFVERFNDIMKGIEEHGGKKDIMDTVLIESIKDVVFKDCKDGVIKDIDGPYSTDVPGVFTKLYVLSHPRDQVEEQSFWILPSVECRAKIETPGALLNPRGSTPQDTRQTISATSTNQGLNQPIGNRNPLPHPDNTKKPGNTNVGPPPPLPSNPKYVIVENPDGGKMLGVVASPFKPTPPQSKQPDKGNQGKSTAPPPPSQPVSVDKVEPYKVIGPQSQRNPMQDESGKDSMNVLPPSKHPYPLPDEKVYSKLPTEGFSGSQNTARGYPYGHLPNKVTYPNDYPNMPAPIKKSGDENKDYRETSSTYDSKQRLSGQSNDKPLGDQYLQGKTSRDGKGYDKISVNAKPGSNEYRNHGKSFPNLDNLPFIPIDYHKQVDEGGMPHATSTTPFTGKEASPSFKRGHNTVSQPLQTYPYDVRSPQKHNSEENDSGSSSGYLADSESDESFEGKKPREQAEATKGHKESLQLPINTSTQVDNKRGKQIPGSQPEIPPKRKPLKPVLGTNEEFTSFIERHHRKWKEEEKDLE